MAKKPYYSSITVIILLPLLILLVSSASNYYYGYKTIDDNYIDKLFHVLGGMSIYISASGGLWHLAHRDLITLPNPIVFRFLAFGFLCFVVITWEIFEYLFMFPLFPETISYPDTIIDMISGLAGGLFAIFLVRRPVG